MAGHVHNPDRFSARQRQPCKAEVYGHLALFLFFEPIGVNACEGFNQSGFAVIYMTCGADNAQSNSFLLALTHAGFEFLPGPFEFEQLPLALLGPGLAQRAPALFVLGVFLFQHFKPSVNGVAQVALLLAVEIKNGEVLILILLVIVAILG